MAQGLVVCGCAVALCAACATPARRDTPQHGRIAEEVLSVRGFAPPAWVRGSDGQWWAVSARPVSSSAIDLVVVGPVEQLAEAETRVRLTPYHKGPSDWATVGYLIRDLEPERLRMEGAIRRGIR